MNAPIDITGIVLHTARLTLRPFCMSDAEDLFAYASVDGVGQMAGWLPHRTIEDTYRILKLFIREKKTFAIEYDGHCIGSFGIEYYDETAHPTFDTLRCREIGYVLSKAYWGQGLMPEAVNAVLTYLFGSVNLDAVFCANFTYNKQSARVQEKCGFHYLCYGTFQTQFGTTEQTVVRILHRDEWTKIRNSQVSA